MNLRHAAALALAVYLVTPPLNNSDPITINFNAPLSAWDIGHTYDTEAECEAGRLDWIKRNAAGRLDWIKRDVRMKEMMRDLVGSSKCVASDDPRLKE